jgi:Fic family protein
MNGLTLREHLITQREHRLGGNIYWKTQIDLAYNSNRIEGSCLSREQTQVMFDTGGARGAFKTNDVIETANHFRLFDFVLDNPDPVINADFIKACHGILKAGTVSYDGNTGQYKTLRNEVAGIKTAHPTEVAAEMDRLLDTWNSYVAVHDDKVSITQIAAFHVAFETIHPFLDGNGRIGRVLAFQQCLAVGLTPFIILDKEKADYYAALAIWQNDPDPLCVLLEKSQERYRFEYEYLIQDASIDPRETPI